MQNYAITKEISTAFDSIDANIDSFWQKRRKGDAGWMRSGLVVVFFPQAFRWK